jgi:hypothetical protein
MVNASFKPAAIWLELKPVVPVPAGMLLSIFWALSQPDKKKVLNATSITVYFIKGICY